MNKKSLFATAKIFSIFFDLYLIFIEMLSAINAAFNDDLAFGQEVKNGEKRSLDSLISTQIVY